MPFVTSQGAIFRGLSVQALTLDRPGTHNLGKETICGCVSPGVGEDKVTKHRSDGGNNEGTRRGVNGE